MRQTGQRVRLRALRRNAVEKPFRACVENTEPMQDANGQAVTWAEYQGQYVIIA